MSNKIEDHLDDKKQSDIKWAYFFIGLCIGAFGIKFWDLHIYTDDNEIIDRIALNTVCKDITGNDNSQFLQETYRSEQVNYGFGCAIDNRTVYEVNATWK